MLSIKNGNIPQAVVPISSSQFPFWDQLEAYSCLVNSRTSVQVMDTRWALWKDGMMSKSTRGLVIPAQGFMIHIEGAVLPTQDLLSRWLAILENSFAIPNSANKVCTLLSQARMIYACLGYSVSFQWFGLNAFLVHSESHSLVSFRSWYQIPWNSMRTEGLRSGPLRQVVQIVAYMKNTGRALLWLAVE